MITNTSKLVEQLARFISFVQYMDGQPEFISFRNSAGFLGREEDYKSRIAEDARKELNQIQKDVQVIDLPTHPMFSDAFMDGMIIE